MNRRTLKTVFLDTLPVMTGYLFLGAGFGILVTEKLESGILIAFLMSLFMYAGSGQFLLVGLLSDGTSLLGSAVAMFLLNARHIFYGISLLDSYKGAKGKPYLIFGLTDETYSLVTQNKPPEGMSKNRYCFLVTLFDHSYWVIGSVLGALIGHLIPWDFKGIEFVLTALFVTMLVEQWLSNKNHLPAIIGVASTVLCLVIFGRDIFLIPSMVLIAVLLTVSRKTGRRASDG